MSEWLDRNTGMSGQSRLDHEDLMALGDQYSGLAQRIQEDVSGLVGYAESEDGRIKVGFSHENGIEELTLDPRALRDGSEELAERIREVSRRAKEDLVQRVQEAIQQHYPERPDPEEALAQAAEVRENIEEMSAVFQSGAQRMMEAFEQFERQLEEDIRSNLRPESQDR